MTEDESYDLTCSVAVALMPPYLDDALDAAEAARLEQHIMVCPGCSTYLAQLRRTIAAVAGLRRRGVSRAAPVPGPLGGEPGGPGPGPVVAYKFLPADRISPFARVRWPEPGSGLWMHGSADGGICGRSVHACRPGDLAYWLDGGYLLWRVELAGQLAEEGSKIAAERGRLLAVVNGWPEASEAFVDDCLARLTGLLDLAGRRGEKRAERFLASYQDEIAREHDRDPVSVSYTAAHAADVLGWTADDAREARARGTANPFDDERRRQSRWLADRLELAGGTQS
jgi:putative zinc finger protein